MKRGAAREPPANGSSDHDDSLDDPRFLPFERNDAYGLLGRSISPLQKAILALCSVLAVVKLLGALLCLLSFWTCCRLSAVLPPSARVRTVALLGRMHTRVCVGCLGFMYLRWVRVKPPPGAPPPPPYAAIVSNHCSWADILIMMSHFFPSFVARHSTINIPLIGVISQLMGCIYVDREQSFAARQQAGITKQPTALGVSSMVKQRMLDMAAGKLPDARPVLLFPEGTTTNGHYLLPFKSGAFLAGLPVQPVVLRYGQGRFSPTWEMMPAARHMLLMLFTPLHSVTCYELPVYVPNEKEKVDPQLYAANVRQSMMEFAPWLHDTDATFEDKKRLERVLIRRLGLDKKES